MTAFIVNGEVQNSQDWYAWFYDRQEGYWQVSEDWYAWFNERAPINTELNASFAEVESTGSAVFLLEGIEAEAQAGEVTANASIDALATVEGIEALSEIEAITATGNGAASVQGASAQARAGAVTATGDETIMVSSGFSYRTQRFDARIRLPSLISRAEAGEVVARGETIIHNRAKVISISAKTQIATLEARGVLDIEENDLILLLAA
jgi:hypothetical protein